MTSPIRNVSDTALWVAMYRALESERPDALFHDPYARRLAGERGAAIVNAMPRARFMAWPMVVRTQVMDEILLRLVREGVKTIVNLACGLDARAFRLALPASLRWFDVDLPDMIAYRREHLAEAKPVCRHEHLVADLSDSNSHAAVLARVREAEGPALVVTEGLLVYLTSEQVTALATHVHEEPQIRFWPTDLASPSPPQDAAPHLAAEARGRERADAVRSRGGDGVFRPARLARSGVSLDLGGVAAPRALRSPGAHLECREPAPIEESPGAIPAHVGNRAPGADLVGSTPRPEGTGSLAPTLCRRRLLTRMPFPNRRRSSRGSTRAIGLSRSSPCRAWASSGGSVRFRQSARLEFPGRDLLAPPDKLVTRGAKHVERLRRHRESHPAEAPRERRPAKVSELPLPLEGETVRSRDRMSRRILLLIAVATGSLSAAAAESSDRPLSEALRDRAVVAALDDLNAHRGETAESLREMGAIRSPSGEEQERARWVAARMRALGLSDVRIDSGPNVIGVVPGTSGKALVFVSTLDDLATVAANQETSGAPRVEGGRVVGPGTNTSSTTAAMLAAASAIVSAGLVPEHDLVFAAVAQEETGLVGMKKLYEELGERVLGYVDVLGDGRRIAYGAIVIHWWKVVGEGPAGHTLGGGLPNVNQGLARAIDRIFALPQPEQEKDRRTVLNISMVRSGAVFNHKPESGWFSLDLRSLDASTVEEMEAGVQKILAAVGEETGIRLRMEPFQLTPGGQLPGARDSLLVRTSEEIARHLGFEPTFSDAGSSNMNVAIAGGTPAIGLGGERGGERGTPEEWASIPAMMDTARHVLLLAATVGGARGPGKQER